MLDSTFPHQKILSSTSIFDILTFFEVWNARSTTLFHVFFSLSTIFIFYASALTKLSVLFWDERTSFVEFVYLWNPL